VAGRTQENLTAMAAPMIQVPYTPGEYRKLYPEGKVTTPIGVFKMGDDFYEKLGRKDDGEGHSIIMSVAKPIDGEMVVVTTYQRHTKEVYRKIKKADSVVYQKDN
jgi:hypothetical protein